MSRQSDPEIPSVSRVLQQAPVDTAQSSGTALSRLCRYYLACMGYDDESGVSIFASQTIESPDYFELKSLPPSRDTAIFKTEAARELMGKLRLDRHRLTMYLGYPVALRKHKTPDPDGKGFKIEPVFLSPVEFESGKPQISGALPIVNLAVLRRFTAAEREAVMDELVALEKELGLTGDAGVPSLGEIGRRLAVIRPEWPWKEQPNAAALNKGPPLHQVYPDGIFNRAVLAVAQRSPYTQGLEAELRLLEQTPVRECANTVLGHWIAGRLPAATQSRHNTSIEVLPLNREQRQAVEQSLSAPMTIITGPPGTGKSQVVADLLLDAAWQGKRVLFASKNNKAVDVVETRLNSLGPRPIVLRVGTQHYPQHLAAYLSNLLMSTAGADEQEFDETLRVHREMHDSLARLDTEEKALAASLRGKQPLLRRLLWRFYWKRRLRGRSFADLARERERLLQESSHSAQQLWNLWLKLRPMRLTAKDRRLLKQYHALLRIVIDMGSDHALDPEVRKQSREFFPKIGHLLPCWAVTSLSARGRVPFEPGFFDLVVFDEASQCDIASALPLLYRAKAAVIIGDPKQLSHISRLQPEQDQRLLGKFGLVAEYPHWAYSYNSLFDLGSGFVSSRDVVTLREHYRSHPDIIQFSNEFFYEGELRVVTAQESLKRPDPNAPGVRWIEVAGEVRQPQAGGAINALEAQAVMEELKRLMLREAYAGSVGVVSPFREQANLIRELSLKDSALASKLAQVDFLCETVHKFQGDERDLMIFSPVVSHGIAPTALNFLKIHGNLFNVGITRARAALIVVGNRDAAMESEVEYLVEFARYVRILQEKRRAQAHIMPVCKRAASDIIEGFQGGSKTSST